MPLKERTAGKIISFIFLLNLPLILLGQLSVVTIAQSPNITSF
jgi:hypothetical protein